jgi:hypothetical protein
LLSKLENKTYMPRSLTGVTQTSGDGGGGGGSVATTDLTDWSTFQSGLTTNFAGKASVGDTVQLSGNQTIAGQKSFNDTVYVDSTKSIISSVAGGGGETEYTASVVGQPAINSLNTMYTSVPANTQKTVAYLENTGQTVFASTIGVNQPGNDDHAMLDEDGYLSLNSGGDSRIEFDDSTTDDSSSTGFKLKNNGGTLDITTSVNAQGTLTAAGIACNGNLLLSAGSEFRLNNVQFASTDLGDSSNLARLNETGVSTFQGNITTNAALNFGATTHSILRNAADTQLEYTVPTNQQHAFFTNTQEELRIGAANAVFRSADVYAGGTVSINNRLLTSAEVTGVLTSDTTANSTKLLIESGAGTGFDGSSTSLLMTKINPVVIHSTQHVPDGSGGWTAHPASTANTFTCNCLGTFTNGLSVSSGNIALGSSGEITRGTVNVIQKLTELHTHWQNTVTLTRASANTAVTLFDTDDAFTRYEFGTNTGATDALNASTLATGCFNLLLSFQGYTAAGVANAYLFGSDHIHTNLKVVAYGIPGYNVGTNDTTAPNSVNVPVSQSYHISSVDPPTVRWQAVGGGPALIQLVWSSTMPTITTGTTVVTCKLVKIADWA